MAIRDAILQDVQKRLDSLVQFSANRREWYLNQRLRIADRQSTQIALVSSISASILAISVAFSPKNLLIDISFLSLLLATIGGVILILLTVNFDERTLRDSREEENTIFSRLKASAKKVLSNPTPEEYSQHSNDFRKEISRIEGIEDKYQTEKKVLTLLYWFVLAAFTVGIIFLAIAWFTKEDISVGKFKYNKLEHHFKWRL